MSAVCREKSQMYIRWDRSEKVSRPLPFTLHYLISLNPCRTEVCKLAVKHSTNQARLSLRKAVEAFSQRVRQLETFVQAHNLAIPPADPDNQATLDQLSSLYAPEARELDPPDKGPSPGALQGPHAIPDIDPVGQTAPAIDMITSPQAPRDLDPLHIAPTCLQDNFQAPDIAADEAFVLNPSDISMPGLPFNQFFDVDWVWNHSMVDYMDNDIDLDVLQAPEQHTNGLLSDPHLHSSPSDPSPPTLLNDEESTDDDEDQSVVTNELSHRFGSLLMTDSGERHFYGATSNLHLVRGGNLPVMYANRSDKGQKAQARLEATDIDEESRRKLEDRLVQLFFAWHNPSLYIVDEAIFTKAREECRQGKQDTLFYSPFLLNAM